MYVCFPENNECVLSFLALSKLPNLIVSIHLKCPSSIKPYSSNHEWSSLKWILLYNGWGLALKRVDADFTLRMKIKYRNMTNKRASRLCFLSEIIIYNLSCVIFENKYTIAFLFLASNIQEPKLLTITIKMVWWLTLCLNFTHAIVYHI